MCPLLLSLRYLSSRLNFFVLCADNREEAVALRLTGENFSRKLKTMLKEEEAVEEYMENLFFEEAGE